MAPAGHQPDSTATVEELCRRAAAGDAPATERLLWAHHDRLSELARRKVGPDWHGKIDPEDVLQEAYVDIFAGIARFRYDGDESFYRWAAQIVERRFIDQVRRVRARKRDATREQRPAAAPTAYQSLLDQCARHSATPSRFVRKQEALGALLGGMAGLPPDYRIVLERHFLRQESLAVIAADMQRTEDAIRRLIGRALERLRDAVGRASRYFGRAE
jgi:RNA polymerase sigma-70 factor (ECF subfamily)